MDYWEECISISFEDNGIKATKEQIQAVAGDVESSHENYGMAHGHDCIPNPLRGENDRLKKDLEREKGSTSCNECKGKGTIITYGGTFQSESQCYKCNGTGKIY